MFRVIGDFQFTLKRVLDQLDFAQGRLQVSPAFRVFGNLPLDRVAACRFLLQGLLQSNQLVGHKIADFQQSSSPSGEVDLSVVLAFLGLFEQLRELLL